MLTRQDRFRSRRSLLSSCGLVLLQAGLAGSEDMESVTQRLKVELTSNATLHFFQFGREEFNGIAARRAHHVVMRAAIEAVLVSHHAVLEVDLEGQSALGQQFERAIHRRVS